MNKLREHLNKLESNYTALVDDGSMDDEDDIEVGQNISGLLQNSVLNDNDLIDFDE